MLFRSRRLGFGGEFGPIGGSCPAKLEVGDRRLYANAVSRMSRPRVFYPWMPPFGCTDHSAVSSDGATDRHYDGRYAWERHNQRGSVSDDGRTERKLESDKRGRFDTP